jgi:hypothetical protein
LVNWRKKGDEKSEVRMMRVRMNVRGKGLMAVGDGFWRKVLTFRHGSASSRLTKFLAFEAPCGCEILAVAANTRLAISWYGGDWLESTKRACSILDVSGCRFIEEGYLPAQIGGPTLGWGYLGT